MDWSDFRDKFDPAQFHRNAGPEVKWIVEHLRREERRVLDVGCLDSGLMDLLGNDLEVFGVDTRPVSHGMASRVDIRNVKDFYGTTFTAIVFLSTLEHIGLRCYGNKDLDEDGDRHALESAELLLSPGGRVLITAPYDEFAIGKMRNQELWERRYNYKTMMFLASCTSLKVVEYIENTANEHAFMMLEKEASK